MVGQKGYVPFFGNTQWCCETEFFFFWSFSLSSGTEDARGRYGGRAIVGPWGL